MRHLAEAWLRTARRVEARGDVAGSGADLLGRYSAPDRGYHDLTHLDEVLRHVDDLAPFATDADAVRLAAWFHDAHYDPGAPDNEERSARLAESMLTALRVEADRVSEVVRLVLLTASHDPAEGDRDGAVLCDADLAVLASDPARYTEYTDGVRREHADVDDEGFARGRAAVLRGLLDHAALFRTPSAHAAWEARARQNVNTELARLEAPHD